jgi:hypothetical protein
MPYAGNVNLESISENQLAHGCHVGLCVDDHKIKFWSSKLFTACIVNVSSYDYCGGGGGVCCCSY